MLEIKITEEAQKILFSAAEDNGQIIKVSTICGTTIQAGMFSIELGDLNPRERANWECALEEYYLCHCDMCKLWYNKNEIYGNMSVKIGEII